LENKKKVIDQSAIPSPTPEYPCYLDCVQVIFLFKRKGKKFTLFPFQKTQGTLFGESFTALNCIRSAHSFLHGESIIETQDVVVPEHEEGEYIYDDDDEEKKSKAVKTVAPSMHVRSDQYPGRAMKAPRSFLASEPSSQGGKFSGKTMRMLPRIDEDDSEEEDDETDFDEKEEDVSEEEESVSEEESSEHEKDSDKTPIDHNDVPALSPKENQMPCQRFITRNFAVLLGEQRSKNHNIRYLFKNFKEDRIPIWIKQSELLKHVTAQEFSDHVDGIPIMYRAPLKTPLNVLMSSLKLAPDQKKLVLDIYKLYQTRVKLVQEPIPEIEKEKDQDEDEEKEEEESPVLNKLCRSILEEAKKSAKDILKMFTRNRADREHWRLFQSVCRDHYNGGSLHTTFSVEKKFSLKLVRAEDWLDKDKHIFYLILLPENDTDDCHIFDSHHPLIAHFARLNIKISTQDIVPCIGNDGKIPNIAHFKEFLYPSTADSSMKRKRDSEAGDDDRSKVKSLAAKNSQLQAQVDHLQKRCKTLENVVRDIRKLAADI
jgi:hypothetical protein